MFLRKLSMQSEFENSVTARIADFLNLIGIEVVPDVCEDATFLPGIKVERGRLLVDESKLKFPGDLLHEAGHLALAPGKLRGELSGEVNLPGFNMVEIEAQSIAWSYAAILYLGLEPRIVFHEGGYKGHSDGLLYNFSIGVYVGVNGLEEAGMTATGKASSDLGVPHYPRMLKWLRD